MKTIEFLKDGEDHIKGEIMLERGGSDMAGKEDLEYYLEHQDEIPKEYQGRNYLIFGNYTKLNSYDSRYVAYLNWDGDRWILFWGWLEYDFDRDDLLVRARKLDSGNLGALAGPSALGLITEMEIILSKLKETIQ